MRPVRLLMALGCVVATAFNPAPPLTMLAPSQSRGAVRLVQLRSFEDDTLDIPAGATDRKPDAYFFSRKGWSDLLPPPSAPLEDEIQGGRHPTSCLL